MPLLLLFALPLAAQQWTIYGGDLGSKRFSSLRQINTSNVDRLAVNWVFQPGVAGHYEATPLFEDGILYFTTPAGHAYALDARNGKLVWEFKTIRPHRGSVLTTAGDLVSAGDGQGYFTAFHARAGKVLWKLQTGAGIAAPAITYLLDGRQYVAVIAGTALFAFALPQ